MCKRLIRARFSFLTNYMCKRLIQAHHCRPNSMCMRWEELEGKTGVPKGGWGFSGSKLPWLLHPKGEEGAEKLPVHRWKKSRSGGEEEEKKLREKGDGRGVGWGQWWSRRWWRWELRGLLYRKLYQFDVQVWDSLRGHPLQHQHRRVQYWAAQWFLFLPLIPFKLFLPRIVVPFCRSFS